ncbi:MAG: InlB B-repeat-containing protein, partial [Clostridia bacterium]|nr:InlB B-repeat-containing protein [Clostridia bacterium]
MSKRILSIFMLLAMIVGMFPGFSVTAAPENAVSTEVSDAVATAEETYTWTFNAKSGTFVKSGTASTTVELTNFAVAPQVFYYDNIWQELCVARSGYVFKGWYSNAASGAYKMIDQSMWYDKTGDNPPGGDPTFNAQWMTATGTMTMDPNGGYMIYGSETYDACNGAEYWQIFYKDCRLGTMPIPERPGYKFLYWSFTHPNGEFKLGDNRVYEEEFLKTKYDSRGWLFKRATNDYTGYEGDYQGEYDILEHYNSVVAKDQTFVAIWEECNHGDGTTLEYIFEPATCLEDGRHYYKCKDCAFIQDEEVIPALDHTYDAHQALEPTCTEIGWEAYEDCSRCDYTTYVELPATGHSLGQPYDGGDGYTYRECENVCRGVDCPYYERIANKYTITYVLNNDSASMPADAPWYHIYGTETQLSDPVYTNYTFNGWYLTKDLSGDPVSVLNASTYYAPLTLYASWTGAELNVTLDPNGGILTAPDGTTPGNDNNAVIPHTNGKATDISDFYTVSRKGYTFTGWTGASDGVTITDGIIAPHAVSGNLTLTAQWTLNVFDVVYIDSETGEEITADYVTNYSDLTADHTYATSGTWNAVEPIKTGYTSTLHFTEDCSDTAVTTINKTSITRENYPEE